MRIFLALWLFSVSVFAMTLEDKIESFVGEKEYKTQKNLIGVLFKNRANFVKSDGSIDDVKVLRRLKDNGILKLFYSEPQQLNLTFSIKRNSLLFMKVMNESLSSMGYNFFLTKRALRDGDKFLWKIIISTEHIVDPLILSESLKHRGCFLESIDRVDENEWKYNVNTDRIRIESKKVEPNRTIKLKKPIKPYWIDVEGMKSISFSSKIADKWYPSIIFYDEKLHIVKSYKKSSVTNRLKLEIPIDAVYVKIADQYTQENIKRGITIYLIGR